MRFVAGVTPLLLLSLLAGCGSDAPTSCCGPASLRVVNAYTTPVDVVIDGNVAIGLLAAGAIGTAANVTGSHTLLLRSSGSGYGASQPILLSSGAVSSVAATRSADGSMSLAVLDDTNSIVAAGATKVRVLHLAPNAGTLQVYRTQPDYPQPIAWQFPFNYQSDISALRAPFFQSTAGTWEVRVWQTPADTSGWGSAPLKIVIPLASGEKKTIVILDKPGGGVRFDLL